MTNTENTGSHERIAERMEDSLKAQNTEARTIRQPKERKSASKIIVPAGLTEVMPGDQ